jgi:hypothetical protein
MAYKLNFLFQEKSYIFSQIFLLQMFKIFFSFLPFNTETLFSSCWGKICYIILKFSSVIGFPHWARNITLTYPLSLICIEQSTSAKNYTTQSVKTYSENISPEKFTLEVEISNCTQEQQVN